MSVISPQTEKRQGERQRPDIMHFSYFSSYWGYISNRNHIPEDMLNWVQSFRDLSPSPGKARYGRTEDSVTLHNANDQEVGLKHLYLFSCLSRPQLPFYGGEINLLPHT